MANVSPQVPEQRKHLVLIWFGIPPISSKAIYQRPLALAEHFDVHLLALSPVCAAVQHQVASAASFPVDNHGLSRLLFPIWAMWRAWQLRRQGKMDGVVTLYPNYMLVVGLFFRLIGVPWVADLLDDPGLWLATHRHTRGIVYVIGRFYHRVLLTVVKRSLRRADLVIGVGASDYLVKDYGVSAARILTVTNGVDLEGAPKNLAQSPESTPPIVLYVGHVRQERGAGTMLHALAQLISRHGIMARLRLVGPVAANEQPWLETEISQLGLSQSVIVDGQVPHERVWQAIAGAAVCLYPFPMRPELDIVSPIKVFEYMALGKAVVASRLTGVAAIIEDGISGLLVTPEDPEALADALAKVLTDQAFRQRLGQQARVRVQDFEWPAINSKIVYRIKEFLADA